MMGILVVYTKNRLSSMGDIEQCTAAIYKASAQAFQGFKDIKVFQVEGYFTQAFTRPLFRSSSLNVVYEVVSGSPGMVLNLLAFSSLLVLLLYLLSVQGDLLSVLPLIAVIAFAVQRALPSVTKIYNSIALLRKCAPGVYIVSGALRDQRMRLGELMKAGAVQSPSMRFERCLRLEKVSYTYPDSSRKVLENVFLEIPKKSVLGIIGGSGVGKSTLVDVLLGLLPLSEGRILCDEQELTEGNRPAFSRLLGYVPQQTFLLDDTLRANVAFGIPEDEIDNARLREVVETAQLGAMLAGLPEGLDSNVGERGVRVSGGQRQRIGIARALYREPEILILDEATSALDAAMENEFNNAIRRLMGERTLVLIAHRLSSLELCTRFVLMTEGGSMEETGTVEDLRRSSDEFRRLYGLA